MAITPRNTDAIFASTLVGGSEAQFRSMVQDTRKNMQGAMNDVKIYSDEYLKNELEAVNLANKALDNKVNQMEQESEFKQKLERLTGESRKFEDLISQVNEALRTYARAIEDRRDLGAQEKRQTMKIAQERVLTAMLTDDERAKLQELVAGGNGARLMMI
tara:strand:+ start:4387 stop:4866 length:480 start_codon:yes stop_codon:yes gene_type:complete